MACSCSSATLHRSPFIINPFKSGSSSRFRKQCMSVLWPALLTDSCALVLACTGQESELYSKLNTHSCWAVYDTFKQPVHSWSTPFKDGSLPLYFLAIRASLRTEIKKNLIILETIKFCILSNPYN